MPDGFAQSYLSRLADLTTDVDLSTLAPVKGDDFGRGVTKLRNFRPQVFDPRRFGAKYDGSDDTTAILDAIAAAKVANTGYGYPGGAVLLSGFALITAPLILPRSGATPQNAVHLLGVGPRASGLVLGGSFPANRGAVEWDVSGNPASLAGQVWHNKIANLMISLDSAPAGVRAIYHRTAKSGGIISNATDAGNEWCQCDLKNILLECDNQKHRVLIESQVGFRMSTWRGVYGDPFRGASTDTTGSTLLLQVPSSYGERTFADLVTNAGSTTATSAAGAVFTSGDNTKYLWALGVPPDTTVTYVNATTVTLSNAATISQTGGSATLSGSSDPLAGEDSIGIGLSHLSHLYAGVRRGGWQRIFQGRFYDSDWSASFDNGPRSGDGGSGYWFYNSWGATLRKLSHESQGTSKACFRFTKCQSITGQNIYAGNVSPTEPAWQATHAYNVGDRVVSTLLSIPSSTATTKKCFRCTVAGTSAGGEPTWPASGTVADGGATWQVMANDAVSDSYLFESCRDIRLTGRYHNEGAQSSSSRLTYAATIDASCQGIELDNWRVRATIVAASAADAAPEFNILAAASKLNSVRGYAVQGFNDWHIPFHIGLSLSDLPQQATGTAPTIANSGTISHNGLNSLRVTTGGVVTGAILQAAFYGGQRVSIINESANSITFANAGTSNMAINGETLPAFSCRTWEWDGVTTGWYHVT